MTYELTQLFGFGFNHPLLLRSTSSSRGVRIRRTPLKSDSYRRLETRLETPASPSLYIYNKNRFPVFSTMSS